MFQGKRPFLTGLLTVNHGYHNSWLMNPTNICTALSSAHGFLKHLPDATARDTFAAMAKVWVHLAAETRKRQSKLDDERKL